MNHTPLYEYEVRRMIQSPKERFSFFIGILVVVGIMLLVLGLKGI
jgi:Tfp pilus assembly protein PilN